MKVLVTGAAGFIGSHVSHYLLNRGDEVIGLDNLNDYYDVNLKQNRLQQLEGKEAFKFKKIDISEHKDLDRIFDENSFDYVIHLAAQAGVRYSIDNPRAYLDSNIAGTLNVLEACRHNEIKHLVYASSSSVYGADRKMPFSEHHGANHPVSLYGATKKSNEMMAHSYSSMYNMPITGLRFFTVYGPWGRPDMAYFKFAQRIMAGEKIQVFNHGRHQRDFTFINDIVEGIVRVMERPPIENAKWDSERCDPASSYAPYKLYNIGNNSPVELGYFIELIEKFLNKTAKKEYLPMQQGDVLETYADVKDLQQDVGFIPTTSIEDGLKEFIKWYLSYYGE